MNTVNLIGRLTREPELRYTGQNQAYVRFTLAVDKGLSKEKRMEMESRNIPTADFIGCVAWGQTAELISNYMNKGYRMGAEGRIQTGSYEKDGQRIFTTDVVVNRIHFLDSAQTQNTFKKGPSMNQNMDYSQPVNSAYDNDSFEDDTQGFYEIQDNDSDVPF